MRLVPTWTRPDGSVVTLGFSGMAGAIDSRRGDISDQTIAAYGMDLTYAKCRWKVFLEGSQMFGTINPTRLVSGGPSNRLDSMASGIHYTRGAVTYRCTYSMSFDSHPAGTLRMAVLGATIAITKNIDLYVEYVNQHRSGNADPALDGELFNSLDYTINWRF
jgi:hypothetical protein